MSSEFTIEQLGGNRLGVSLRGYALPHWGQASFLEVLNTKKTTYQGNPQATIQVLGYEMKDTEIGGLWMTRKLQGMVTATYQGAGEIRIESASALVDFVRRMFRGGQQVRVQWENVVRIGVIKEFNPDYKRIEDIRWSISFEWSKDGDVPSTPRSAPGVGVSTQPAQTALNTMQDQAALVPVRTDQTFFDGVRGRVQTMRNGGLQFMRRIQTGTALLTLPLNEINGALSVADTLRVEGLATTSQLLDVPVTAVTTSNTFIDTLKAERWRRGMSFQADRFSGEINNQARRLRKQRVKPPIDTVVCQNDTTLRSLSTRYYGTPDEWQRIANANGLVGSVVPAGTRVVIPAGPQA